MTTPTTSGSADSVTNSDYEVQTDDNITLFASKIIRDVLVTPRGSGPPSPTVAGGRVGHGSTVRRTLTACWKSDWFTNQDTGLVRWKLTEAATAGDLLIQ